MSDVRLARLRRYAYWLDAGIQIPGTRWRIGVDSLLGLIPGFGDAAGAVLSAWIFLEALRRSVPAATLARVATNIGLDALVGAIPVAGDVFDFVWKANLRNIALLERHASAPAVARRADRRFVAVLAGGLGLLLLLSLVAAVFLGVALVRLVLGG